MALCGVPTANCTWRFPSTRNPLPPERRFHPSPWKGHEGCAPRHRLRRPAGTALSARECLRTQTHRPGASGWNADLKHLKRFKTRLYRKLGTLYPPPRSESDHCSSFGTCFHGDDAFGGCGASLYCPEGHEHRYRESCGLETRLLVRRPPPQCVCVQWMCVYARAHVSVCVDVCAGLHVCFQRLSIISMSLLIVIEAILCCFIKLGIIY